MTTQKKLILGISLGTRRLGIAVGTKEELIDWQVKGFYRTFSQKEADKICRAIERIIETYNVTTIAMKAPHPVKRSAAINYCLSSLSYLAQSKHISMYLYSIEEIEKQLLKKSKKNKLGLATCIYHKYPELQTEYRKVQSGKAMYYSKVFEAAAVIALTLTSLQ